MNTWWDNDPTQRYWMQITDRDDLDGPLLSPKLPRLTWGYDLVSQVQPGDRVLHWWTRGAAPGLVGWSEVKEHATVIPEHYVDELGGTDYEEVGKPYDIRVTVQGVARRCEVKGSSMEIDTVELTTNEVEHGTAFTPIDLIVVDSILPTKDPVTGEVMSATGGRRRVWVNWTPAQLDLKPTKYAYTLPAGEISPMQRGNGNVLNSHDSELSPSRLAEAKIWHRDRSNLEASP